ICCKCRLRQKFVSCCVLGLFLGVVDDGLFCCCFKFRARAHGHDSSAIGYPTNFTVSCSIHLEYAEKQRCWHIQGYRSRSMRTTLIMLSLSAYDGEFNESTQHLLILADEEVCEWRGMHGPGSRRNRRLSCGSAGRAVNVWRTSRERLRGGTRAASIGFWLAMEGLLQRHAGGLWERCGLRSAKRFRGALPPVGRYGGSHRASNDRPQLSAERSDVTAAAAPTAPARLISAPGGGHCAQSLVAWRAMPSYDGASRRSSC